jgi:hypothetical protein
MKMWMKRGVPTKGMNNNDESKIFDAIFIKPVFKKSLNMIRKSRE